MDDEIIENEETVLSEEEILQAFVPNVHFELIPIRNLVSNQDYQRSLSLMHIRRAAENFDLYQINPVKVSRRDGVNYVFNGQHTIEIVASVSKSRNTPVWCMVYDDLEYEHEADIFANQLKYTKSLTAVEIFNANIEANNDDQLIIRDLVKSYGLTISGKQNAGTITAVSTLENIYFKYGFHVLNQTLRLISGTWEGENGSFSSGIMMGIALLINTYGELLKDDIFKDKLGVVSIKELTRTAKDRKNGSLGYAEAMVIFYNRKSKTGLRLSDLYKSKKRSMTVGDYIEMSKEEESDLDMNNG